MSTLSFASLMLLGFALTVIGIDRWSTIAIPIAFSFYAFALYFIYIKSNE